MALFSKLKQAHQSQSTLKTVQEDINMKGQPQVGDTISKCDSLELCRRRNAHTSFKTCAFATFKAVQWQCHLCDLCTHAPTIKQAQSEDHTYPP